GVILLADGLQPRRAVNVRNSGDDIGGLGPDRGSELHEGGWTADIEEFLRPLEQHYRRQRTKPFPLLDSGVDPVTHVAMARISQNAAMTECARAEFAAPVVESDHLGGRQQVGYTPVQIDGLFKMLHDKVIRAA